MTGAERHWPDVTEHLPAGVRLRAGIDLGGLLQEAEDGRGSSAIEVDIVEIAAVIAGEPPSRKPAAVCPHVIAPFAALLSDMNDEARPRLAPFAWAIVGTASPPHLARRLEILARMAIDAARLQTAAFDAAAPSDDRVDAALSAASRYWADPSAATAEAANAAHQAATAAANVLMGVDRLASVAAHSAAGAAHAAHSAFLALRAEDRYFTRLTRRYVAPGLLDQPGVLDGVRGRFATSAAEQAAIVVITPEDLSGADWRRETADLALAALRRAIEAGPYGAVPPILAAQRLAAASF